MFARHFIDSLDFARNGRELRGEIPVAELPRLQDMLAAPDGEIAYVLRGMQGIDGKPMLEMELKGQLQLTCQRCLQSMAYPVNLVSRLILVRESELDNSPAEDDSEIDSIPADRELGILELFEEELLLSLPFAPRHPEGSCRPMGVEGINQEERSPFAVLAGFKNK